MLQTPGDASVGELHGSIKQGRRHAAKRFYSEAAKQPSNQYTHTELSPVAINTNFYRFDLC